METIVWDDTRTGVLTPRELSAEGGGRCWELCRSAHFHVCRWDLAEPLKAHNDGRSFRALHVVQGAIIVTTDNSEVTMVRGDTCLLPAALGAYVMSPKGAGAAQVVQASL
jgi:mannose-6-phosphate isomerase class I